MRPKTTVYRSEPSHMPSRSRLGPRRYQSRGITVVASQPSRTVTISGIDHTHARTRTRAEKILAQCALTRRFATVPVARMVPSQPARQARPAGTAANPIRLSSRCPDPWPPPVGPDVGPCRGRPRDARAYHPAAPRPHGPTSPAVGRNRPRITPRRPRTAALGPNPRPGARSGPRVPLHGGSLP